ncbi:MAG: hypothetical protein JNK30_07645 [Phenylobacterium sp.]|uniref:hypothetical protein n=1 Tax=Phenylobacterium sp. TaxID=1871053 RepID=UPI001A5D78CC|nr:hypothetical protein [Phenylobacterium sp.]MBL8771242.1 hypothetical protein [Phenylobacterium sp.]
MARDAASLSAIRASARLANGFALDLVKLGGFGRDVIDGLLLTAISQANVTLITRSPELQARYATLDQAPPDDLRRPVSLSALSNSLRIPFETVRRRVTALADLGIVRIQPRGVILPSAPLSSPLYRMMAEAHYNLVRSLYVRLRAIGLLEHLQRTGEPAFETQNPPMRLVNRLSAEYLLRLAEPISREVGDVVTGLILMDIIQANTQHLPDGDAGSDADGWSPDGFVPDEQRKGVRAATLSERLGIAPETVRRHLARLAERDLCERKGDGFVVPARVLARELFVQYMLDNQSHVHRLCSALADFGVLPLWEREILSLKGAA